MKYKKQTFIIVVLALVICIGLTACLSSNPQSDIEQPNPGTDIINNDDDSTKPPVLENTAYPIQGDFADEDMLGSGNYHEFIADNSEYMVKLVFQANEVLTDVRFTSLEYNENGTLGIAEDLYTLSELTPDKPLVTGVVFYGSMTVYGISFVDTDGQTHYCAASISGQDGSLLLNEYDPSVAVQPTAEPRGTTEVFNYRDDLKIEVSGVREVTEGSGINDMGEPFYYTVYVCYPEAKATVLAAGMNDGEFYGDGLPHPQYGFAMLPDDDRLRIAEEMVGQSISVTEMKGAFHLESSIYLLMFEIQE